MWGMVWRSVLWYTVAGAVLGVMVMPGFWGVSLLLVPSAPT